jgi:hypothetical protein
MSTTDICDMEEFKDDPECKKKKCGLWENIFWSLVLIAVAFFLSCWTNLLNRVLDKIFGERRSDIQIGCLAAASLIIVLILGCHFEVDLEY